MTVDELATCPKCGGKGVIYEDDGDGYVDVRECPDPLCHGGYIQLPDQSLFERAKLEDQQRERRVSNFLRSLFE